MTIIFESSRRVKSSRPFGQGVLASKPHFKADHSATDEAWLIEDNARREETIRNAELERQYQESTWTARYELGICF